MKYRVRTATLLLTVAALCIAGFSGGGMALLATGATLGVCLWMIPDITAVSPTRRSAAELANRIVNMIDFGGPVGFRTDNARYGYFCLLPFSEITLSGGCPSCQTKRTSQRRL
jgi:hypothetical protein